jgi:hypothetical protein
MDGGVQSRGTTFLRACPTTLVTGSPASGARVRSPVLVRPRSVRRSRLWHMREPLALLRARPPFRVLPRLSPPAAAGLTLTTLSCSSSRRRPLKDRSSRTSHHRPSTPPSATAPFTLPLALLIASPTPSSSSSPSGPRQSSQTCRKHAPGRCRPRRPSDVASASARSVWLVRQEAQGSARHPSRRWRHRRCVTSRERRCCCRCCCCCAIHVPDLTTRQPDLSQRLLLPPIGMAEACESRKRPTSTV